MTSELHNNSPRIAIIIPVYNRKKDVLLLLESVFELDYSNFDVIIVDNGSTDNIQQVSEIYPEVRVLKKDKNYGATVGFNSGLEHAASSGLYKYVWMLDSDLIVEPDCLGILVDIIERDDEIGIIGPKILNVHNKELIVEIGANIDLESGQVYPFYCNEPDTKSQQPFDVDYLGSGISLIRVGAYKKVGPMDERYFFLWDDMDYGLAMKRAGYKVVAVPHAAVLHPPFTEKRSVSINAYYGVRSVLLTIGKYESKLPKIKSIYHFLRRVFKMCLFRFLAGSTDVAKLNMYAIYDFCNNKWGVKSDLGNIEKVSRDKSGSIIKPEEKSMNNILILQSGSSDLVSDMIEHLKHSNESARISMLVQNYRKNLFESHSIDEIILYDDKKGSILLTHFSIFIKLLFRRFDYAINPDPEKGSPFTYALRNVYDWDEESKSLIKSSENIYYIWKIPLSVLLGEFLAIVCLPFVYFASIKYEIKD